MKKKTGLIWFKNGHMILFLMKYFESMQVQSFGKDDAKILRIAPKNFAKYFFSLLS